MIFCKGKSCSTRKSCKKYMSLIRQSGSSLFKREDHKIEDLYKRNAKSKHCLNFENL